MREFNLEDWFPMSPLKGPPLPAFLDIFWPWVTEEEMPPEPGAADIRVEDLTITPSEVTVGEKVIISVLAKNYGDTTGTKTITCTVS